MGNGAARMKERSLKVCGTIANFSPLDLVWSELLRTYLYHHHWAPIDVQHGLYLW